MQGRALSTAHARKSDPFTSHLAADSISDTSALQRRILVLFEVSHIGLNDEQLIAMYKSAYGHVSPATDSSLRSRRNDLVVKGHLRDSGQTRPTATGHKSIVWIDAARLW